MWWPPYVSVAEKRARAEAELKKLRKVRKDIKPVTIEGRTIASTFWGKGWCKQMESLSDFENRLPRGRSYVRNNTVLHLDIREGEVDALVMGTELYKINVSVAPLLPDKWTAIKKACSGKIGSMIDLLQGKLSSEVMNVVCDQNKGMFPVAGEMAFECSCPDWASLCKHIAAVFYAIGNRLDHQPELLFLLRHVDPGELFTVDLNLPDAGTQLQLDVDGGDLFGIDLVTEPAPVAQTDGPRRPKARIRLAPPPEPEPQPVVAAKPARKKRTYTGVVTPESEKKPPKVKTPRKSKAAATPAPAPTPVPPPKPKPPRKPKVERLLGPLPPMDPTAPTGPHMIAFREAIGYSSYLLSSRLGVTMATLAKWESAPGAIGMNAASLKKLERLFAKFSAMEPPKA
ncbi:MAG: SWIM zinc finger family protein [Desulfovibrio sp.]|jgi:hypothetical protein|nr:SWIM zinc finger family protein [Desulfovibrio sp.]